MKIELATIAIEVSALALHTFKELWDARFDHRLTPPIKAANLEEKAAVAELKKLKLITTFLNDSTGERYAEFKADGDELGEMLDMGALKLPKKPVTKKATKPSKAPVDVKAAAAATKKETPAKPAKVTKEKAPAAAPAAPAAPVDRTQDRYAAVRETIAAVKDDAWDTKRDYELTIKHLTKTYGHLFKRGWKDDKKRSYMEGIVKFALKSTRKG